MIDNLDFTKILEKLQPGTKWRIFYNPENINNKLAHIRAIIDDDMVVWRFWSYQRQNWIYQVDHIYRFQILDNDGHLQRVK